MIAALAAALPVSFRRMPYANWIAYPPRGELPHYWLSFHTYRKSASLAVTTLRSVL